MSKDSERYFTSTAKHHGFYWHKYGDVRYCIHCKGVLPKTETMPDYALFNIPYLVECKNDNATGRWNWRDDIGPEGARQIQRKRLGDTNGWLYVVIGQGKAPSGKSAWLIPWISWLKYEEILDQASIPLEDTKQLKGARGLFSKYELIWTTGIFEIPKQHPFWLNYYERLQEEQQHIREIYL